MPNQLNKILRSEEFHFGGSSGGEMPHFMQFSVATHELCTLHCALGLQWHKMYRKCPQHPSISLLTTSAEEKQIAHRLLFLFLFGLFTPWYECICDRFDCGICCDSCAGIFKWNFDYFLWETVSHMKESRLTCGSHAQLTCSILLDLPLSVICICIKCSNSFKTSLHNNFSNNLFHIKNHISFSSL